MSTQQPTQQQLDEVKRTMANVQPVIHEHDDSVSHERFNVNSSSGLKGSEEVEVVRPTDAQEPQQEQVQVSEEDKAAFNRVLQSMGVSQEQFEQVYNAYQESPEQASFDVELRKLDTQWGVSRDETQRRLQTIQQNYSILLEQHPELDTLDGAITLWQQYESSAGAPQPNVPTPQSRLMTQMPNKPNYKYTESQIRGMNENQRAREHQKILDAYQQGLVLNDMY